MEGIKKIIFKGIHLIHKDISFRYGGWLWFTSRLLFNGVVLYYLMNFISAFYMHIFQMQEHMLDQQHVELISTLTWAVGMIYLVTKIGTWKDAQEEDE